MKKILSCVLVMILTLTCFTACNYESYRFYNSKILKEFQITDFPKPQGAEYVSSTNSMLCFNTTAEGFEDYAKQIYTYLVGKDFKYFGYRGDVISTFFGAAPEYEFYISSEFSEHRYLVDRYSNEYDNCYIFVFSDELSERNGLLNKCEIKMVYSSYNESYNSFVSINYTKKSLFSYTLIPGKEVNTITDFSKFADMTRVTDKIEVTFDNNSGTPFYFTIKNTDDIDEIMNIIFSDTFEYMGEEVNDGNHTSIKIIQGQKTYEISLSANKEGEYYYEFSTTKLYDKIHVLALKAGAYK